MTSKRLFAIISNLYFSFNVILNQRDFSNKLYATQVCAHCKSILIKEPTDRTRSCVVRADHSFKVDIDGAYAELLLGEVAVEARFDLDDQRCYVNGYTLSNYKFVEAFERDFNGEISDLSEEALNLQRSLMFI
jgi:hypothetical protein